MLTRESRVWRQLQRMVFYFFREERDGVNSKGSSMSYKFVSGGVFKFRREAVVMLF